MATLATESGINTASLTENLGATLKLPGSEAPQSVGGMLGQSIDTGIKTNPDLTSVIRDTDTKLGLIDVQGRPLSAETPPPAPVRNLRTAEQQDEMRQMRESFLVPPSDNTTAVEQPAPVALDSFREGTLGYDNLGRARTAEDLLAYQDKMGLPGEAKANPAFMQLWEQRHATAPPKDQAIPEPAVDPLLSPGMQEHFKAQDSVSEQLARGDLPADQRAEAQRQAVVNSGQEILTPEQKGAQELLDALTSNGGDLSDLEVRLTEGERLQNPLTNKDLTRAELQSVRQRQREIAAAQASRQAAAPNETPVASISPSQENISEAAKQLSDLQSKTPTEMWMDGDIDPTTGQPFPTEDAARAFKESETARLKAITATENPNNQTSTETIDPTNREAKRKNLVDERAQLAQELIQAPDKAKRERLEQINQELNALGKDPNELRKSGVEKLARGEQPTDDERAAMDGESVEDVELSPEDEFKEAKQTLEDIGTAFLEKVMRGEDATAEGIAFKQELGKYLGFSVDVQDIQAARDFMKGVLNPEKAKDMGETAKMKFIKEQLQELARMELQLRQAAETVKRMEEEEKNLKDAVNKAESDYTKEQNPAEKQKKGMIFSGVTMRLTRYQEAIKQQANLGKDLWIKQRQVRGKIHRQLGTRSRGYNLLFGAGTAIGQGWYAAGNGIDSLLLRAS